jgi:hypothetical protein
VRQVVAGDSGVPAGDLLAVRAAAFRCSGERGEYERLLREQTALDPESARLRFLLAMSLRQSKRPAEAVDILLGIYPARDLGWLPEPARSVYWLELAANWHQLGEYDFELVTAARMTELAAPPLAVALVEARSLAGLGTPEAVLARGEGVLDSIRDIGILTGITRGLAPRDLVTPGWVNYVAAVELAAHGHTAQAGIVAAQATAWYRRLTEPTPTDRYVLARSLELTGEFGEALALARTLSREDAGNVDYRGLLGVLHARSGDMPAADTIDAWLSLRRDWFPPGLAQLHRARIAAVRGDAEGAIRLIESLPGGAHPYDVLEFHVDPAFASLRDDAAFQRFLRPRE